MCREIYGNLQRTVAIQPGQRLQAILALHTRSNEPETWISHKLLVVAALAFVFFTPVLI